MVGSPAFLGALSPEDRKIFDDAAAAAVVVNRAKVETDERDGVAELKKRGMDVQEVDRATFQAAMASANAEFETQFGAPLLASIRDWKAK